MCCALLEGHDGLLVLPALDVRAPEPAVVLDERHGVFAFGVLDDADGVDEVVQRIFGITQLGLDEPERREIGRILRLALLALRADDGLRRLERRGELARAEVGVAAAAQRRERRRCGRLRLLFRYLGFERAGQHRARRERRECGGNKSGNKSFSRRRLHRPCRRLPANSGT